MSPGGARLFVAVDLPGEVRAEIAGWGRRAVAGLGGVPGGVRPLEAGALHVTLCFLGTQPTDLLEEIAAAVAGAPGGQVGPVGLGPPVWLPRRRPRALAIGLHDETGGLGDLAGDVGRALGEAIGWEPESRRFRPHVTVARMRAGSVVPGPVDPTPPLVFEPEALTLYRSRLDPGGAVYQPVVRVGLSWPVAGIGGQGPEG
ncbi:MAG: RNA 2',3'-cyclic phosphodiesterase [Actinobacteria bacterium]|nr:RNA 2',3'-cyclic phosphodiesterase [Actinomycetota bacterium]